MSLASRLLVIVLLQPPCPIPPHTPSYISSRLAMHDALSLVFRAISLSFSSTTV